MDLCLHKGVLPPDRIPMEYQGNNHMHTQTTHIYLWTRNYKNDLEIILHIM